ncbi:MULTISPECIES: phosphate acyltransferase PlsX [Bacillus]|uniref:Phosphate acyltransferase n=1 Tax=Bacillus glycinifermentans TaxID=1664069 RepID=A0AAJ4D249_9BACI|nr:MULTISPECIES: phosphate acyltransferase PlsX [Bacillus]KKB75636.1 phosphate acyltransferase [Bacillus sp. TH008]MDU0071339.1 phosphate acyltransferase PlsX [Bacillus sp. IG6]MED8019146.1 phosphate acyltransferase PlsX [Bacillus glycinifermentans]QAT65085.1 phosphate acyltransferase PlsX [Bacillus glycinifermentans]WKB79057.1 phosphate acyltransferase PlsX [Bacillus glycinifermentans]
MRIAVDAMGGDNAPKAVIDGVMKAVKDFQDLEITLIGDREKIAGHLTEHGRITVKHAEEVIEATDEPVRAVRRKKNSSMVLMAQEVAEGRADACISAGNTGALMTAGLFIVGRIEGIERPALAPTLPTVAGDGFLLLDVGANVDAKPEHLVQYAIMGSVYGEQVLGVKNPRIGLLNVGTEDKKGNELAKQTFQKLKETDLNFIGNVEARDMLDGVADVIVTDGFTGNVALKTVEGAALSIFKMLKSTLTSSFTAKLAASALKPKLKEMKTKMDYSEYGGAGLFGLKAPVIKAHGSSDGRAVYHAIRQAREMVSQNVAAFIEEKIQQKADE